MPSASAARPWCQWNRTSMASICSFSRSESGAPRPSTPTHRSQAEGGGHRPRCSLAQRAVPIAGEPSPALYVAGPGISGEHLNCLCRDRVRRTVLAGEQLPCKLRQIFTARAQRRELNSVRFLNLAEARCFDVVVHADDEPARDGDGHAAADAPECPRCKYILER